MDEPDVRDNMLKMSSFNVIFLTFCCLVNIYMIIYKNMKQYVNIEKKS